MGLQFKKATVNLSHDDMIAAIRQAVESQGYSCGEVVIACSPHQYNGPGTFSATAEVEPKLAGLPTVARTVCRDCGKPIAYIGPYWDHEGDDKPKHPAVPLPLGRKRSD